MKHWFREFLGINDLARNQQQLYSEHSHLHNKTDQLLKQMSALGSGLGRVIAKLDARFAEDESNASPERKAESDRIGEEVIKRLEAEAAARAPHNL